MDCLQDSSRLRAVETYQTVFRPTQHLKYSRYPIDHYVTLRYLQSEDPARKSFFSALSVTTYFKPIHLGCPNSSSTVCLACPATCMVSSTNPEPRSDAYVRMFQLLHVVSAVMYLPASSPRYANYCTLRRLWSCEFSTLNVCRSYR